MTDDAPPDRTDPPPQAPLARYTGPDAAAPYPLSRMAPAFDMIDVAREIPRADEMLATVTGGKLSLIADQIRHLQDEARRLLEAARRDADLHRVKCSFEKKPGGVYHRYRRESGEEYFSLLAPHERSTKPRQSFVGTYRLEADMSFSVLEQA